MSGRRVVALVMLVVAVLLALALHRTGLAHVRDIEASYVSGRKVTACATLELAPFRSGMRDMEELPSALADLVADARSRAESVRDELDDVGSAPPYPRLGSATREVRAALDAEVALYEAMVDDPEGSRDELDALGTANRRAERALDDARRVLFVGASGDWQKRNSCIRSGRGEDAYSSSSSK